MAGKRRAKSPDHFQGKREVIWLKVPCGWCMTGDHKGCKHELAYYEKLWICGCSCNKNWKPVEVESSTT